MRIGQLAQRAGVPTKTIRYYETVGVMPPPHRAANGYRVYDEDALRRLRFVRDAQASGLSLAEIATVTDMRERGERTCDHVLALLRDHLAEIDVQIDRLVETRRRLTIMAERAAALDPAACSDPDRCQTIEPHGGQSALLWDHLHRPPPLGHSHER